MLSKITLLTATATAGEWNYDSNGSDWADLDLGDVENQCGGGNQSPINLVSRDGKGFNKAHKNKIYKWNKDDEFEKSYDNAWDRNPVFNGHTYQTDLDVSSGSTETYQFTSKLAETIFGADTTFDGQQFHLHAGSEHTIDGVRHDFEMHTVHYPTEVKEGFIAAAMGIVFSVEDYTAELTWAEERIIDTFFDSLQMDDETEAGPNVDMVTYGNLMQMVDMNNRWVYKGSVTTPPCAENVYWNVLSTIYPIKAEHLALFEAQLDRTVGLKAAGNWREIQETTDAHTVSYVQQRKNNGLIAWPLSVLTNMLTKIQAWVTKNK